MRIATVNSLVGSPGGLRDLEYRTPALALISYVSAEMVAAGQSIDPSNPFAD